jgi:hypothetical protein
MTASERSTAGQSLLFPLQFTYADEGPEVSNGAPFPPCLSNRTFYSRLFWPFLAAEGQRRQYV